MTISKGWKMVPHDKLAEMKALKALKEITDHDRSSCNCEKCKKWWLKNIVQTESGLLFEFFPSIKDIDIDRFHREFIGLLRNLFMDETLKRYYMVYYDDSGAVIML